MNAIIANNDIRKFLQDKRLRVIAQESRVSISTLKNICSNTAHNLRLSTVIKLSKYIISYQDRYGYSVPIKKSMYGYQETKTMINIGGYLFDRNVISTVYLWLYMEIIFPHMNIGNEHKRSLLQSMGYYYHGSVRFEKKLLIIWTKEKMSNREIRSYLSSTRIQFRDG